MKVLLLLLVISVLRTSIATNLRDSASTESRLSKSNIELVEQLASKYDCGGNTKHIAHILEDIKKQNENATTTLLTQCGTAETTFVSTRDAALAEAARLRSSSPGSRLAAYNILEKNANNEHVTLVKRLGDKVANSTKRHAAAYELCCDKDNTRSTSKVFAVSKSAYDVTTAVVAEEKAKWVENFEKKKTLFATTLENSEDKAQKDKTAGVKEANTNHLADLTQCRDAFAERMLMVNKDGDLIEEIVPLLEKLNACGGKNKEEKKTEGTADLLLLEEEVLAQCAASERHLKKLSNAAAFLEMSGRSNSITGGVDQWKSRLIDERSQSTSLVNQCETTANSTFNAAFKDARDDHKEAVKDAKTLYSTSNKRLDDDDKLKKDQWDKNLKEKETPFLRDQIADTKAQEKEQNTKMLMQTDELVRDDETLISIQDRDENIRDAKAAKTIGLEEDENKAASTVKRAEAHYTMDSSEKKNQCESEISVLTEEKRQVHEIMEKVSQLRTIRTADVGQQYDASDPDVDTDQSETTSSGGAGSDDDDDDDLVAGIHEDDDMEMEK